MSVPVLIETDEASASPETWVCGQAVERWLGFQHGPIGLASCPDDLATLLQDIETNELEPSIFVVNTFGARKMLQLLDAVIGESPVIFLRRRLHAGKSGFVEVFGSDNSPTHTGVALSSMKPRLTSFWRYGGKTSGFIAKELCDRLYQFQQDKDFRKLETQPEDIF